MIGIDSQNLLYIAASKASKSMKSDDYAIVEVFFHNFNDYYRNSSDKKFFSVWEGVLDENYRRRIYPHYKTNRNNQLRDKINSNVINMIQEGLKSYGVLVLQVEYAEGDDLIYGCCEIFKEEKEIFVISRDTDFIQLYQKFNNVKVYDPYKREIVGKPDYDYILYKSLKGDDSDSIEGLNGIGAKRALNILNNYETIYKTLNEDSRNIIERNLKLIDISKNADMPKILEYIRHQKDKHDFHVNNENIKNFYKKYKLANLFKNFSFELGTDSFV